MKNKKTLKPVSAAWKRKKFGYKKVFLKNYMIRRKKWLKEKAKKRFSYQLM